MQSTFYFYANPFNEQSADTAKALWRVLSARGSRVLTEEWLAQKGVGKACELHNIPMDTRALIAFGGDGTLLRAAPAAAEKKLPMLGIHTGTVGFLMQGDARKVESIAEYLLGDEYSVDEYPLLSVAFDGKSYLAVNDLALTRGEHPGVIEITALADQEEAFCAHGDGAVVSTPLGATAYGLSAGGPIVRHDAPCLMITPLCARELLLRPVILPLSARVTLLAHGRDRRRLQLAIDGQTLLPVTHEARVDIALADETIRLIRLNPPNFFDTLRKKQAVWNQW